METLEEWQKDWQAIYVLHQCTVSAELANEWATEIKFLQKQVVHSDCALTFINLQDARCDLHLPKYEDRLLHPAIRLEEPDNFKHLTDLTMPDNLAKSLQTELVGYDLLMSLPHKEQKRWWMKYHRLFKDKQGRSICYLIRISVHLFDDKGVPWILKVETSRLPEVFEPGDVLYREFSHCLPRKIAQAYKLKLERKRSLTCLEKTVLLVSNEGYSLAATAAKMELSEKQVKNARERIFAKTKMNTIALAYQFWSKHEVL
jgi:DNA-binding CsgD family transcriptional regulator